MEDWKERKHIVFPQMSIKLLHQTPARELFQPIPSNLIRNYWDRDEVMSDPDFAPTFAKLLKHWFLVPHGVRPITLQIVDKTRITYYAAIYSDPKSFLRLLKESPRTVPAAMGLEFFDLPQYVRDAGCQGMVINPKFKAQKGLFLTLEEFDKAFTDFSNYAQYTGKARQEKLEELYELMDMRNLTEVPHVNGFLTINSVREMLREYAG